MSSRPNHDRPRPPRLLLIPLILFLGCSGCSAPKERAKAQLRGGGAEELRHDAAVLYKEIFSGRGKPDFVEVWYKKWPDSFQKLAPRHVGAYIDGFSIAMQVGDGGESGLYIVPQSMDCEPKALAGTSYQKLAEGTYWYSFGK